MMVIIQTSYEINFGNNILENGLRIKVIFKIERNLVEIGPMFAGYKLAINCLVWNKT